MERSLVKEEHVNCIIKGKSDVLLTGNMTENELHKNKYTHCY